MVLIYSNIFEFILQMSLSIGLHNILLFCHRNINLCAKRITKKVWNYWEFLLFKKKSINRADLSSNTFLDEHINNLLYIKVDQLCYIVKNIL